MKINKQRLKIQTKHESSMNSRWPVRVCILRHCSGFMWSMESTVKAKCKSKRRNYSCAVRQSMNVVCIAPRCMYFDGNGSALTTTSTSIGTLMCADDAMQSVASFCLACVCAETDAAGRYTNPFAFVSTKNSLCFFSSSSVFLFYGFSLHSFSRTYVFVYVLCGHCGYSAFTWK